MDVLYDSEHDMANAMKKMFDPFERIARSKHYCPCCKRGFNPEEEDDFVKKVSLSIWLAHNAKTLSMLTFRVLQSVRLRVYMLKFVKFMPQSAIFYLWSHQSWMLTCCFFNVILQQRVQSSDYTDQLREHARLTAEAEMKVQSLDKLRSVYDDHQRLSNELIPAAEKSLVELRREKEKLTDAHDDVQIFRSCFFLSIGSVLSSHCN